MCPPSLATVGWDVSQRRRQRCCLRGGEPNRSLSITGAATRNSHRTHRLQLRDCWSDVLWRTATTVPGLTRGGRHVAAQRDRRGTAGPVFERMRANDDFAVGGRTVRLDREGLTHVLFERLVA